MQASALVWAGENYMAQCGGQCFHNTVSAVVNVYVLYNGSAASTSGVHQCAVASFQSWAHTAHATVVLAEGFVTFGWGWSTE